MKGYRVTASRSNGDMASDWFEEEDDGAAMARCAFLVMAKAKDSDLWARGAIELRDIEDNLVAAMKEKT